MMAAVESISTSRMSLFKEGMWLETWLCCKCCETLLEKEELLSLTMRCGLFVF